MEGCRKTNEPTSVLWTPGPWLHQKQPPSAAVCEQRRPRDFSATGFGVTPVVLPRENSVLPGEEMARADVATAIDESTVAAIALERAERNPHMFGDDVPSTASFVRKAVLSTGEALRDAKEQEKFMRAEFPTVPTRLGMCPIYSGRVQGATMTVPTAAGSVVPGLDVRRSVAPLAEMLKAGRPPKPDGEVAAEG